MKIQPNLSDRDFSFQSWLHIAFLFAGVLLLLKFSSSSSAQSLGSSFAGLYSIHETGLLPVGAGDSQIEPSPSNPNAILIGDNIGQGSAAVFQFQVTRGNDSHIIGITPGSVLFANAHASDGSEPLNAAFAFGPGKVLLFAASDPWALGQIKSGSTSPDKIVNLSAIGYGGDLGGGTLAIVPAGFPGAGQLKLVHDTTWMNATLVPDGNGTFDVSTFNGNAIQFPDFNSPNGILFVPAGPGFSKPSVLIGNPGDNTVSAYDLNAGGDPILTTRRIFLTGVPGMGMTLDPSTGDILFTGSDPGRLYVASRNLTSPPVVRITAPVDGATFEPGNIGFSVVADQPNGVISEIRLYNGPTLLTSSSNIGASHFENLVGADLKAGNYGITAVAIDGSGLSSTSSVVNVHIGFKPPVVALIGITNGQTLLPCGTMAFIANATPGSGSINHVEFFLGTTKLGQSSTPPFFILVSELPLGTNILTARATDSLGSVGVSANLTVNVDLPLHHLAASLSPDKQLLTACFTGNPGTNYILEASTALTSPAAWTPVQTNRAGTALLKFIDPSASKYSQRFYRVRAQ